ncbi:hypothetical protein [Streptomyces sp. 8N706]|uniref:hypothetical protein n=1 Tax=Streptomyces sp. 8N706 TaxID=3457416 RepID=UPI003FD1094F
MRLRTALTAAITPVLMVLGPVGTAEADRPPHDRAPGRGPQPFCGDPNSPGFPIETRIHGGPDVYPPGGDWQTWNLDLRNTTAAHCSGIHPVAVLVDHQRSLDRDRIGLEFYDPGKREWRPVSFETTDQDEQIGVFEGGRFKGFVVPRHKTVTVKVRMRFSGDTGEDRVRVNVATVQRRDDDGDWVGESNDYEFDIRRPGGEQPRLPDRPESHDKQHDTRSEAPGLPEAKGDEAEPERPLPAAEAHHELARTGEEALPWIAGAAALCLVGGVVLVALVRRRTR